MTILIEVFIFSFLYFLAKGAEVVSKTLIGVLCLIAEKRDRIKDT